MAMITIKKTAQGKYTALKNGVKVATLTFTKKHRPAPWLPVGYMITISVKGKKLGSSFAKSITEGKCKLLKAVK